METFLKPRPRKYPIPHKSKQGTTKKQETNINKAYKLTLVTTLITTATMFHLRILLPLSSRFRANKGKGPTIKFFIILNLSFSIVNISRCLLSLLKRVHSSPYFIQTRKSMEEINATIIALIPKVPNPSSMGEFRPISCCNTLYKCISKIISSQLKRVLPSLIDPPQSTFILGQNINDSIL